MMKEDAFVRRHAETWRSLERLMDLLKSRGLRKWTGSELDSFILYYNRTCGHLSQARTHYPGSSTADYLNRLVARAHSMIYSGRSSNFKRFLGFFTKDFPVLLHKNTGYLAASFLVFLLGYVLSLIYTLISPDNAIAFLPKEMVESIHFGDSGRSWDNAVMSSTILTNNIRVGFTAFALGITFAAGTGFVLIYNGFMLGAISALAHHSTYSYGFWSLILPHGILELFAIFVCGGAGMMIGWSLISPGEYSRKDALILKSKAAVRLVAGTIPIFILAGLIEGYFTPLPIPAILKYAFALFTLALLIFYLVFFNLRSRRLQPQG